MTTVELLRTFKESVGPEAWLGCLALVSGAVTRTIKAKVLKRVAALVALVAALLVSLLVAAILGEPWVGAVADAVAAAGMSVAVHQVARLVLARYLGEEAATALLGRAIVPRREGTKNG